MCSRGVYIPSERHSSHRRYNAQIYYKMILKDGSLLWFKTNGEGCKNGDSRTENVCALIWYDTNGPRPPYTLGKDVFVFFVLKDAVVPHSNDDCSTNSDGWGCSRYILEHGERDICTNQLYREAARMRRQYRHRAPIALLLSCRSVPEDI